MLLHEAAPNLQRLALAHAPTQHSFIAILMLLLYALHAPSTQTTNPTPCETYSPHAAAVCCCTVQDAVYPSR